MTTHPESGFPDRGYPERKASEQQSRSAAGC